MVPREADTEKTGRIIAHHGLRVHIDIGGQVVEWKPPRRENWVVGDYVRFEGGRPKALEPRRNEFSRLGYGAKPQTLAANLDLLLIVTACDSNYKPGLIDRFIVSAGHSGIGAAIVLNKTDLPGAREYIEVAGLYEKLGYDVHQTSAVTGDGVEELGHALQGKTSALVGHSGVGKTSLLNRLAPGLDRPTGDVHDKTSLGRHVTSASLLVELPGGGFIIDSPGIRQFAPSGLEPEDVARYFPGFADLAGSCKFRNCMHISEPRCAIKKAVEDGLLEESLYESYKRMYESVKEHAEPDW